MSSEAWADSVELEAWSLSRETDPSCESCGTSEKMGLKSEGSTDDAAEDGCGTDGPETGRRVAGKFNSSWSNCPGRVEVRSRALGRPGAGGGMGEVGEGSA